MTAYIAQAFSTQFFDGATVAAGYSLYTYDSGTVTPKTVYKNQAGTVAHTNPIVLDADGMPPGGTIWITSGEVTFVLKDLLGATVWTRDDIAGSSSSGDVAALRADLLNDADAAKGAAIVGYRGRTVHDQFDDIINIRSQGADEGGTPTANTTAFLAAFALAAQTGAAVYVPGAESSFKVNDELPVPDGVTVFGSGWYSCVEQTVAGKNLFVTGDSNEIRGLRMIMPAGNNLDISKQHAVYANGSRILRVLENYIKLTDISAGVMLDGSSDVIIRGNTIFGGLWNTALASAAATVADILCYSSSPGARIEIAENFCLSNNSQGIGVDLLGNDGDLIISGNICVTLDTTTCTVGGTWSEAATGGVRRHGIMIGYNSSSVNGPRAIITNNICRNTRWTGIYKQGVSSGPVLISGNICSKNGYDTVNSVSGGIYANLAGQEKITNNWVADFQNTNVGTAGITVNATTIPTAPADVTGNTVRGSLGLGLIITTNAALVNVELNTFSGNAGDDIVWVANAGNTALGGHKIQGNKIYRMLGNNKCGINLSPSSSQVPTYVEDNEIHGFDNTNASDLNTGIRVNTANKYTRIRRNNIENFYYGVYVSAYWTGREFDAVMQDNEIQNCNTGFAVSATTTGVTVPLVGNKFIDVTNKVLGPIGSVAGRICRYAGDRLIWESAAAPTVGSWAVGDRSENTSPAVGQPKAWSCTVAGSPGTWASEGNL